MPLVSAAVILAIVLIYYRYSIIADLLIVAVGIALYCRFSKEIKSGIKEDPEYSRITNTIMLVGMAGIVLFRFFRLLSYPADFVADEWNGITAAYFRISGQTPFFDYNPRFGSSFPYVNIAVISAMMCVFKENLDALRLIPAVVSILTAGAFFVLGRTLKNKKFGIILSFLFLTGSWALFLSRKVMENIYIPLFAVSFIAMLMCYVKTMKKRYLIFAGLIFFLGFYTYSSWILMAPIAAYFIFEYRKEFGKKNIVLSGVFILLSLVVYMLINIASPNASRWAAGMTVLSNGNFAAGIAGNIVNIFKLFVAPLIAGPDQFAFNLPALSAVEMILLAGGITAICMNYRNRETRFFLVSFLISLFTVIISSSISHLLRHAMVWPFAVIISGYFLYDLTRWKYTYLLITTQLLLFCGSLMYYFTQYESDVTTSSMELPVAKYINGKYGNSHYTYIYTGIGSGAFSSYLRTKAAYEKNSGPGVALVVVNYLKRSIFYNIGKFDHKYFYDYNGQHRKTLCLYEVPLYDPNARAFFIQLGVNMESINKRFWQSDYAGGVQEAESVLKSTGMDRSLMFWNTMIRLTELTCVSQSELNNMLVSSVMNQDKKMYLTADNAYNMGQIALQMNDIKSAGVFFGYASKMAPEWDMPRQYAYLYQNRTVLNNGKAR